MAIAGEILTLGNMPANKAVELGERIMSSAQYMSSMVDDMLEFARTRLGNTPIPIQREMVNIKSVCSRAITDAAAMHRGCVFELTAEGKGEAFIDADRTRQLLMNLLGNAGQHGAPGRPVKLYAKVDEAETVFRVINEGPEIPANLLETIFEPLVRLNAEVESQVHRTTSLGLGLHIAREIAVSHGGSITVQSENQLTTFTVAFPATT